MSSRDFGCLIELYVDENLGNAEISLEHSWIVMMV
jgi:hypothetical protein